MVTLRKDVKLGLLIGAIVLSVVGVYLILSAIAGNGAKQVAGAQLLPPADAGKTKTEAAVSLDKPRSLVDSPKTVLASNTTPAPTTPKTTTVTPEPIVPSPTPPTRSNDPWASVDFGTSSKTLTGNSGTGADTAKSGPLGTVTNPAPGVIADPDLSKAVPGATQAYEIEAGDTFSAIAQRFYGDSKHFQLIVNANPSVNPNKLKPGIKITIPPLPAEAAKAGRDDVADVSAPTFDPTKQYRVLPGDSLHKIAAKLYGTTSKWSAIYQANHTLLKDDATKLKPDMVLTLPEPPTVH
ncbi:MAG: LysM peptidoglycan-binding domain-containing protein [Tepidisphaeraceae bacterium]